MLSAHACLPLSSARKRHARLFAPSLSAFITTELVSCLEEDMDDACAGSSESLVSPQSDMGDLSTSDTSEASISDVETGTALNDEVCMYVVAIFQGK